MTQRAGVARTQYWSRSQFVWLVGAATFVLTGCWESALPDPMGLQYGPDGTRVAVCATEGHAVSFFVEERVPQRDGWHDLVRSSLELDLSEGAVIELSKDRYPALREPTLQPGVELSVLVSVEGAPALVSRFTLEGELDEGSWLRSDGTVAPTPCG